MRISLRDAFAHFDGAVAVNPRWAWAAQSTDGATVVVTMWRDLLRQEGDHLVFEVIAATNGEDWHRRPGHGDRTAKLRHVRQSCDDRFVGLIVESVKPRSHVRSIKKIYRVANAPIMRIEAFDDREGTGRARSASRMYSSR